MSIAEITYKDMLYSLTGHDEDLIYARLGIDIGASADARPMKAARGCVAIHRLREGDKPAAAVKYAMELSLKDVNEYFQAEDDELDEEAGNDDGEPESEPTSSPSS